MRNLSKGIVFGATALALCSAPALAEGPAYGYVEGGYLSVDVDELDDTGDNYFLGASFGGKSWHINGYYSDGDLGPDVEQRNWRIGLGWHGLLGDRADVVGEAAYVDQTIEADGSDEDENGYRVVGGVRWVPIKLIELAGFANYNDVGTDSGLSYEARGILNIWRLGFGAAYEKFDDVDQWNAFVRFNFLR